MIKYFLNVFYALLRSCNFSKWKALSINDFFLLVSAKFALRTATVLHLESSIRFFIQILITLLMSLWCRHVWTTLRLKLYFCCIWRALIYFWMTLFCLRLKNAISTPSEFCLCKACSLILRAQPHNSIFLHSVEKALLCSFLLWKFSAFVKSASSSLFLAKSCSFWILLRASARFCLF